MHLERRVSSDLSLSEPDVTRAFPTDEAVNIDAQQ